MNIEKINDLWLPSDDAQIEQWREKGVPHMQDKCLKSFLKYCESQNKKFKRVLDIGAWCGTWSIAMEKYIRNIDAFEPNKTNFACLEKNVARFSDRIKSNRVAIGDKDGLISLTDETATQNTRIKNEEGEIPMHTVDYFNYSDVDFIKIDVEGMEKAVLEGAKNTIEKLKPIIFVEILKSNPDEIHNTLSALGYKIFPMGMNSLAVSEEDSTLKNLSTSANKITIKSSK